MKRYWYALSLLPLIAIGISGCVHPVAVYPPGVSVRIGADRGDHHHGHREYKERKERRKHRHRDHDD